MVWTRINKSQFSRWRFYVYLSRLQIPGFVSLWGLWIASVLGIVKVRLYAGHGWLWTLCCPLPIWKQAELISRMVQKHLRKVGPIVTANESFGNLIWRWHTRDIIPSPFRVDVMILFWAVVGTSLELRKEKLCLQPIALQHACNHFPAP